jgi:hypothetical protein
VVRACAAALMGSATPASTIPLGLDDQRSLTFDADVSVVRGVDCTHVPTLTSGEPKGIDEQTAHTGEIEKSALRRETNDAAIIVGATTLLSSTAATAACRPPGVRHA